MTQMALMLCGFVLQSGSAHAAPLRHFHHPLLVNMVTLGPFLVGLACLAASTAVVAKGLESTSPGAPVISGSGAFRYQYDPTKLLLPPTVQLLNGHGLARDRAGNIYFTYESTDKTAASVRAYPL